MHDQTIAAPPATPTNITPIDGLEHLEHRGTSHASAGESHTRPARAVLYLRVSTPRQMQTAADLDDDGNSIATQREWARGKAAELGASIIAEFVEPGHSAQTIKKRPEFRRLLEFVDEHPDVTHVIIYMRSRVFRNYTDAAITKRDLGEKGVRLVSAKEQFGDGYMGDAMEAITDIMNEVQVRQSGEDIAVKMAHKVAHGGSVSRAKIGYLNVRKDIGGALVNTIDVDPERAPLVSWAFEQYATGRHSIAQLCALLEDHGLVTRASRKWPAGPLSKSRLAQMLRDPYYTGVIRYKGKLHSGRHQPLVSKETFLAVQDVLDQRNRKGDRDRVHFHFLRGLLYCNRCHAAGRTSRLVYTQHTGNGGSYEYFVCTGKQRGVCDMRAIRIEDLEAEVARLVAGERIPGEDADTLQTLIASTVDKLLAEEHTAKARLREQLTKLDAQEERLVDLVAAGNASVAVVSKRLETTRLQRGAIAEKLERTEQRLTYGAEKATAFLDLLRQPGTFYREAPNNARRDLILTFFDRLLVDVEDKLDLEGERNEANAAIRQALPRAATFETKTSSGVSAEGGEQAPKQFACSPGSNKNYVAEQLRHEPGTTEPKGCCARLHRACPTCCSSQAPLLPKLGHAAAPRRRSVGPQGLLRATHRLDTSGIESVAVFRMLPVELHERCHEVRVGTQAEGGGRDQWRAARA
ncbi:hypothetical protein GCM10027058_29670 [Microbacterium neimengense]